MASSFQFRNVTTYVVEPEGEPIQSLPSKSSLDFSPQSSCIEEAPNDGNQYARQSKSWQEVVVPTNTSDLNNDSGFITDSSLTKENIVGLKIDSTPEFADTQITPLAVEATYTPTVWSYLVGLFNTVPKSVKEHIVKIWGELSKKGELIVDITLQSNVSEVNISVDMFGNQLNLSGDFQMILDLEYITSGGAAAERNPYIQFNGITSSAYRFANSLNSFWNPQAIANRNRNYVNHILSIRGGKLSSLGYATGWTGTTQSQATSYNLKLESTVNALQSIKIFQSADLIKSGSTIKLYRL